MYEEKRTSPSKDAIIRRLRGFTRGPTSQAQVEAAPTYQATAPVQQQQQAPSQSSTDGTINYQSTDIGQNDNPMITQQYSPAIARRLGLTGGQFIDDPITGGYYQIQVPNPRLQPGWQDPSLNRTPQTMDQLLNQAFSRGGWR